MMLFQNQTLPLVADSLRRAYILNEQERQRYSTELMDIYQGFGTKYIEQMIDRTINSKMIKEAMKKLVVCYPLLQNFIDEISLVYRVQPTRTFYMDGKALVKEKPDDGVLDPKRFEVNPDLLEILEDIYDREFCARIKRAESMTNLLSTTVYKINNREGKLRLDFIPNDAATVIYNKNDRTVMDGIYFVKDVSIQNNNFMKLSWEKWTVKDYATDVMKSGTTEVNRAVEEYMKWEAGEGEGENARVHIGSGFAPFVVLRNDLADLDFWNMKDQDIIKTIMQINMAFTELRYLQRFGSFGLKYGVDVSLPDDAKMDPTGFWQLKSDKGGVPGQNQTVQIGELKNEARIEELIKSIFEMIKFLYDLYGVNANRLTSSKQVSSAESKVIDKEAMMIYIEKQQEIWAMNEEYIFETAVAVYNRDNSEGIPSGVEMTVDFYDPGKSAEEAAKEIENWLVRIQNNIASYVDWIRDDNPDLSEDEAKLLIEKNKTINIEKKKREINTVLEEDKTPQTPPAQNSEDGQMPNGMQQMMKGGGQNGVQAKTQKTEEEMMNGEER